jgi:hypothetical protein
MRGATATPPPPGFLVRQTDAPGFPAERGHAGPTSQFKPSGQQPRRILLPRSRLARAVACDQRRVERARSPRRRSARRPPLLRFFTCTSPRQAPDVTAYRTGPPPLPAVALSGWSTLMRPSFAPRVQSCAYPSRRKSRGRGRVARSRQCGRSTPLLPEHLHTTDRAPCASVSFGIRWPGLLITGRRRMSITSENGAPLPRKAASVSDSVIAGLTLAASTNDTELPGRL